MTDTHATRAPGALYRVEIARDLHTPRWPWTAAIYRTTDGSSAFALAMERGVSREEALHRAGEWIAAEEAGRTATETVYLDRLGHQVSA